MALTCDHLDFAFAPGREVLRSVSASFEPGELTAVIGPNGSGKTTLLRLLLGTLEPTRGAAALDGVPTAELRGTELASRIAYLAQRAAVSANFSVRQVVELGRHGRAADDRAVEAAIGEQGLTGRGDEPFARLSAGQQQRVALARVQAQMASAREAGTRCVLADEPIAAMDPAHAMHSMGTLRRLAREGAAVVVVLHDFSLGAAFADRAVLLDEDGRVAAMGRAREVMEPSRLETVFKTAFRVVSGPDGGFAGVLPLVAGEVR